MAPFRSLRPRRLLASAGFFAWMPLIGAGCAQVKPVASIDPASVRGRSIEVIVGSAPSFYADNRDRRIFGIVGVALMAHEGNRLVQIHRLEDPSLRLGDGLRQAIARTARQERAAEQRRLAAAARRSDSPPAAAAPMAGTAGAAAPTAAAGSAAGAAAATTSAPTAVAAIPVARASAPLAAATTVTAPAALRPAVAAPIVVPDAGATAAPVLAVATLAATGPGQRPGDDDFPQSRIISLAQPSRAAIGPKTGAVTSTAGMSAASGLAAPPQALATAGATAHVPLAEPGNPAAAASDLTLKVRTTNWEYRPFRGRSDEFYVIYAARIDLIDNRSGRRLGTEHCEVTPTAAAELTEETLLADDASLLRRELAAASALCLASLRRTPLGKLLVPAASGRRVVDSDVPAR